MMIWKAQQNRPPAVLFFFKMSYLYNVKKC